MPKLLKKKDKNVKHNKVTNKRLMVIIQNLLQIEDKLFNAEHRCSNCIKEKVLRVECEVDSLMQTDHKEDEFLYQILRELPNQLRKLQKKMIKCKTDKKFCKLSQDVRVIRKKLVNNYYNCDKNICYKKQTKFVVHKCPRKIMPVLNPAFNIREVVKNILLLEDHLLDPDRRCMDCIKKHSLIIEGFLEEAITIDKKQKYVKLLKPFPKKMRKIQSMIIDGREKYLDIVKELRKIRKPLLDIAFEFVVECC